MVSGGRALLPARRPAMQQVFTRTLKWWCPNQAMLAALVL
jgi:hypothetical protein